MNKQPTLSRRDFLKVASVTGVGLVIEVYLAGCRGGRPTQRPSATPTAVPTATQAASTPANHPTQEPVATPTNLLPEGSATPIAKPTAVQATSTPTNLNAVSPSLYLMIGKDGLVTVTVPRSEMGQGTRTALAMIVAEELCADWSTVRIEQAPGDSAYGDQATGGSASIQDFYSALRRAGGVGRELMLQAAAETWGVDEAECFAEHNQVVHQTTGDRLAYADLVEKAGQMKVPSSFDVQLKNPADFSIIGTNIGRYDNPQIVTGKAVYGIDVRLPGMLFATVARSPVLGGKLAKFDATKTEKVNGVRQVVQIDCGVAVVAENSWAAMQGKNALDLTWNDSANADLSSAQVEADLLSKANASPAAQGELVGVYTFPYFGHMTMEPMNCTADVRADRCEVWVPTQNPQALLGRIARLAGVSQQAVRVNVTLVGGGFGRRLETSPHNTIPPETDYTSQAVQISKAVGAPVQVVWTREDDLRYDLFHPISVIRVSAKLDDLNSLRTQKFESSVNVPAGYWRSVTNPPEAFAHECFLDEYAAATGTDPLELRRKLLSARDRAVVELAAEKAGWGASLPKGSGRGLAFHSTWGVTGVAEVVEVSVDGDGNLRVPRVVCAIDCGLAVNPDMVIAQVESGVIFGLTATLKENITIEKGKVQQSNFSNYPILRFDEMPKIEVYIVPSDKGPSGVGEMANPPVAPAVANAVYAAIGKRIRRIPIRKEDLMG
jgi:isoquinoline 1-oxidoreductase beta subunit